MPSLVLSECAVVESNIHHTQLVFNLEVQFVHRPFCNMLRILSPGLSWMGSHALRKVAAGRCSIFRFPARVGGGWGGAGSALAEYPAPPLPFLLCSRVSLWRPLGTSQTFTGLETMTLGAWLSWARGGPYEVPLILCSRGQQTTSSLWQARCLLKLHQCVLEA